MARHRELFLRPRLHRCLDRRLQLDPHLGPHRRLGEPHRVGNRQLRHLRRRRQPAQRPDPLGHGHHRRLSRLPRLEHRRCSDPRHPSATSGCPADLTGSSDPNDPSYGQPDGVADSEDFFFYLDAFVGGNTGVCDLTGSSDPNDPSFGNPNGVCDGDDFFFYLDLFVAGCP
ncbi:MAG: GC-type dockerin domain-anchored protein [Phycisphaerales bacterium JB037]